MSADSTPSRLAGKLTAAQRRLMLRLEFIQGTEREFFYRTGFRAGSNRLAVIRSLQPHIVADEVDRHGPSTYETAGRGYLRLTPLGEQVRAHLTESSSL